MLMGIGRRLSARRSAIGFASLVLLALVLSPAPASASDFGKQYSCTASAGLAAARITGEAPQCTIELLCNGTCGYRARADASGAGLVGVSLAVLDATPATPTWVPRQPGCTGNFTCRSQGSILIVRAPEDTLSAPVLACRSIGGLAAFTSVTCSVTTNQD